jgi:TatD DNase family protein
LKNIENHLPVLSKGTYLIDTHCHLDMTSYNADLTEVLERAYRNQIKRIISIGIDLTSSERAISLARRHKQISATIGIHPHDVKNTTDDDYELLKQLFAKYSKFIVGYGEIGLDYVKNYSPVDKQQYHFTNQLNLACELQLPVIIHNREADKDTIALLKKAKPLTRSGIMHCFSGDYNFARQVLDMGLLISIPGIVTFKNATTLHDVVRKIPLTSLVLETDGPFLAPHPYRGKRNEPSLMLHTAGKIAELRNISIDEVAEQTSLNSEKLFQFDNGNH